MDLFNFKYDIYEIDNTKTIIKIQSFWRMYCSKRLYLETLKIIKSERKRVFSEIEETSKFVNSNRLNRFDFLQKSKKIIYLNFPGISLEPERHYGNNLTIKAKADTIGRCCPISKRQHSSNSIYFVLNHHNDSVIVKCFKCTGYEYISESDNLLDSFRSQMIISDKVTKKKKNSKSINLTNLINFLILKLKVIFFLV